MHSPSKNKKILIIDEDHEMGIFLGHLLEMGEFNPVIALDSEDGFRKLVQETPDVILLAVKLDSSGRLQMFEEIKQDKRFQHIPLVLISALEERHLYQLRILPQLSNTGFLSRPDGFLPRPPEVEELLSLVERLSQSETPESS